MSLWSYWSLYGKNYDFIFWFYTWASTILHTKSFDYGQDILIDPIEKTDNVNE